MADDVEGIIPSEPAEVLDAPGLSKIIRAYPYWQYSDDDVVQAYFKAYNEITQYYLDWFNSIGLPVYTNDTIFGFLLDWVGQGVYGYRRPSLPSGTNLDQGPWDTFVYAEDVTWNELVASGPPIYYAVSDDVYKRCLTWHFFKGDGKVINVRWLKRRIMRALIGTDGTAPNIDQTYQISVTFGVDSQINIRIINLIRRIVAGEWNTFVYAGDNIAYNEVISVATTFAPLANVAILKAAIESGVLEMPFQFTVSVDIVG